MSMQHQVAIVQVNAYEKETVRLAQIMDRVPSQEVMEVLASSWARQRGWRAQNGVHVLPLPSGVSMEVSLDAGGDVTLARRASQHISHGQGVGRRRAVERGARSLEGLLERQEQAYNLAFNEVVGRAVTLAVQNEIARHQNWQVVETEQEHCEETHVVDLVVRALVHETA